MKILLKFFTIIFTVLTLTSCITIKLDEDTLKELKTTNNNIQEFKSSLDSTNIKLESLDKTIQELEAGMETYIYPAADEITDFFDHDGDKNKNQQRRTQEHK